MDLMPASATAAPMSQLWDPGRTIPSVPYSIGNHWL